ncbi:5-amino-6-(5-phospho-D-ribitylamino)uracil phosphatase YigB [Vibrio cholerae]|uniref:5-amino-6-(5-phospho-D-ribitylamino)uracil phosphatase YigB n=1 Tax=Vibrio cholerae TaxID=666 RepID=UPI001A2CC893|nr:5-amino-6-(5-phospho-D-ribitylamino)uracil phosphatase YigB [Vibrio cholerae]EGQ7641664.1 5-amino-6-(5-phospho-D-ribitylamino)uracil phosphatase YigB [Vibrio cholerae]EJN3163845.1 5-amino-6-(5-phospho-D-ribitylamino)uracil phosphatase YigB [Vibrio cholerae]EKF9514543.1 5-amino-6-(5-phospho-D-ribitylamino)uracil phosphatase YigB [Vibrio cholerae]MBO1400763.1 2-haloalkanoic acid dehalogenase [Vibrio cholerae]MCD1170204.1 5-amino-6-(5-phospho-D-ribitylamino)uracil phosphatase YigB [Vibrio chol
MLFYRPLASIQALTFDLDDTLYDNRPVIKQVEEKVTEWLLSEHPITATRPLAWWLAMKRDIARRFPEQCHDVSQWRYLQVQHGLLELGYAQPEAEQAASETLEQVMRWRNQVDVPAETHRVLAQLAAKVPLIAITNGNVQIEKIGLSGYFQTVLRAGPDGRAKPYPDLFAQAAQQLQLEPRSILHVGDHLQTDVLGARQNGFQACWFNDQGQSIRRLAKASVLPDMEIERLSELLLIVN